MKVFLKSLLSRAPTAELPSVWLRVANVLGYVLLVLVNVLSGTGKLGPTNADVSAKYPSPLTPAGWAFSIWGLIFALQGVGVIYQLLNNGYRETKWKAVMVGAIGWGWQAGWLFQDLWQICFLQQSVAGMWLAAACLLGALASFALTMRRLDGAAAQLRAQGGRGLPLGASLCFAAPTSINAAWLSVATALGLLIVPVAHGASQESLVVPAALLAAAVTAGAAWRTVAANDIAYGLTLVWALSAVAANDSGRTPRAVKAVGTACAVAVGLCVAAALVRRWRGAALARGGGGGAQAYEPYEASLLQSEASASASSVGHAPHSLSAAAADGAAASGSAKGQHARG